MSDYFSYDVMVQILQRLPAKSLVKFMSVCKAWKSIITNDFFIVSHHQLLQTNPANSSLFFHLRPRRPRLKGDFYSLYSDFDAATDSLSVFKFPPVYTSSDDDSWRVVGTCNGLVYFYDISFLDCTQPVIWNPSILKYLILPKSSLIFDTEGDYDIVEGFGFDSRSHDFKVVRIAIPCNTDTRCQVEIYSLAANSWRTIAVAPLRFRIIGGNNYKFVNGALHWFAYRKINGSYQQFILTFDVVEETFGELMFPPNFESRDYWRLLTGGNLLALIHSSCSTRQLSIWVMKEYGVVESWTRLFHFDSDSTRKFNLLGASALRNNEEVVSTSWDHKIVFLDPTKGLVKKIDNSSCFISFMGDHVESLFLTNEKNAKSYLPI